LQRVCMHSQVLLSTMHVQVCTLDRCCEYQRTHLLHARYKMWICAMYTHVYIHMYMYIYVCMHVCIHICMYFYTYICICIWMYICVYVYVYVYICMYVCICMCIYICICLYIACMRSCFHLTLGNEDGGVQLVYEALVAWREGLFLTEGKIGVLSVSSLFLTRAITHDDEHRHKEQRPWMCLCLQIHYVCLYHHP